MRAQSRPDPSGAARRHVPAFAISLVLVALPSGALADGRRSPPRLPADPVLVRLIDESLAVRPELRRAEAEARAATERVPQAGALPDPVLSLGIQNDGFEKITVGEMESSYYQIMVSQGLPWPGKRGLRTQVAELSARRTAAQVARARLATEADIRRSYVDLLLARQRLNLLGELEGIWEKSAGLARARYEAGEGAQSDVLRAQLELNRLRQRRLALVAADRVAVQTLNRLRTRPLDEPIATDATIQGMGVPAMSDLEIVVEDALHRSPELEQARLASNQAEASLSLARRERFPDLSVNIGVMPRGSLDPMWQAGIGVGLPVWGARKQGRAVEEGRSRAAAEGEGARVVEQLLRLRVAERRTVLSALLETIRLYADGLLVQSGSTVDSTLAQYRVGRVTFASVLEANAGYVADRESYLSALAEAQRLAIAEFEVSLDPVGGLGAGGMAGTGMPGAGSTGGGAASAAASSAAPAAANASAGGGMAQGM